MFFPAADTIAFTEGGTEAMRIDASGNVQIGGAFGGKLCVIGNFSKNTSDENTWGVRIQDDTSMAAGVGGGIVFSGAYTSGGARAAFGSIAGAKANSTTSNLLGELRLYATNASGILTEGVRLNSSGTVILQGGSTSATGVGITFPATQSASSDANCLDDYEEGNWSPSVGGTSTYTAQVGRYTKVGNIVSVYFDMAINTIGTGSTSNITNLPFTTISELSATGCVSYYTGVTQVFTWIGCYASGGTTNVAFVGNNATATTTVNYNGVALFGNGTRVLGSIVYRVA
jgi:hypothetical protein